MPSLRDLGDSDAVDNKYIDRIVFYVEGQDDKNLLTVYLMKHHPVYSRNQNAIRCRRRLPSGNSEG